MMPFVRAVWANVRGLPQHLRAGLRPGADHAPDDARRRLRRSFFYHLHPLKVRTRSLGPATTAGLGLATLTMFILLCVSGALLMLRYEPSPDSAWGSIVDIQHTMVFGAFLQALHRWSAYGMLLTLVLHVMRIVAQAAYRRRELNWLIGLCLLGLTLAAAFTGYLLPWDQRAVQATIVSSNLLSEVPFAGPLLRQVFLGGEQVTGGALVRSYAMHVAVVPGAMLLLAALHLWRVRRDGGLSVGTDVDAGALLPAWPHLVHREALVFLGISTVMTLIATWIPVPLRPPADLQAIAEFERAPWFFVAAQEMVAYSATLGGILVPVLVLCFALAIPYLDREDAGVGVWFGAEPTRRAAGLAAALAVAVLASLVWLSVAHGLPEDPAMAELINPVSGMLALGLLLFVLVGSQTGSTRAAVLVVAVVVAVAVVGFTVVGLCRGPGWAFEWPWGDGSHGH